jgi:hypothetical protein
LIVTADRGLAEVALGAGLPALGVEVLSRVPGRTQVSCQGPWRNLHPLRCEGPAHPRHLGHRASWERAPQRWWVTLRRARDRDGQWETWAVISTRSRRAQASAAEDARRFGCAQGCRDAKGELGFAHARMQAIHAGSRLFALFALALWIGVSVAVTRLRPGGPAAVALLRRVASRRRGRWGLSLGSAMVQLLQETKSLFAHLSPHMKFNLDARLVYVS